MSNRAMRLGWLQGLGIAIGSVIALYANSSVAQITPDGTLPNNSNVTLEGNTFNITGGSIAGGNLFHSFKDFSVPNGSISFFNNSADVQNIISRVTGKSISNIDGLIKANGVANLFLINPNGMIFGENASLDIGGSFIASTASAVKFDSGFEFSATNPQSQPLLTISLPVGLQYGNNAGKLEIQKSILMVKPGQTLALVGGNVNIEGGEKGFLKAEGGRIELGGLTSAGMVGIEGQQSEGMFKLTALRFPNAVVTDIFLNNYAYLDVTGRESGSIAINAQNLEISRGNSGESLLLAGIAEGKGSPEAIAGDITLNATGKITVADGSGIYNNVMTKAMGNAGNINITTGSLEVTSGARLNTGTSGQGNAGSVFVKATDSVSLVNGASIFSTVGSGAVGNGGNINISAGSLSLTDDADLSASTFGNGNAGSVFVKATDSVSLVNGGSIFSTVDSGAVGNGGDININAASLSLKDGAQLLTIVRGASETEIAGRGNAGNVNIGVIGAIAIDGINDIYPSAIFSDVDTGVIGNGGNINISAGSLSLTNGAYLSASIESEAKGYGGNIDVTANSVSLDNGGKLYARIRDNAIGNGGNITIKTESFSAKRNSELEVSTRGQGTSGNINIKAKEFSLSSNAALIGDVGPTGQGGGNIDLMVDGSVSLIGGTTETAFTGESTRITLGVQPVGQGSGGNLTINANSLVLKDGAFIKASTQGEGIAGNININTNAVDISGSSPTSGLVSGLFTSTDSSFKAGDIVINTQTFQIADSAALSARTRQGGQGGNIRVNAKSFEAMNGGQLVTTTAGGGQAGNILINAKDRVTISGVDQTYNTRITRIEANEERIRQSFSNSDDASFQLSLIANAIKETGDKSGLFANTETDSTGKGGDINIAGRQINIQDGAQVTANSQGSGNAGSIKATSNYILLDRGAINADTTGGGGNINLESPLLILRRGSNITTNASGRDITGGNINIDAQNGFIVAVPKENSDIRADSANFRGGNVIIKNIAGIFGIQSRLEPSENTSDITAKGATPALSGNIEITQPDIDPSRGFIELPINLADASNQISNACTPGSRQFENTFVATGRGGFPISPTEPLQENNTLSAWVKLMPTTSLPVTKIEPSVSIPIATITEASGWIADKSGNIELVASQTPRAYRHSVSCSQ